MKKVFKYLLIILVVLGIGVVLLLNNLSDSRWSEAIEYYSDKYDFSAAANNHKASSGSYEGVCDSEEIKMLLVQISSDWLLNSGEYTCEDEDDSWHIRVNSVETEETSKRTMNFTSEGEVYMGN